MIATTPIKFSSLKDDSKGHKETNDCSVKALTAISGRPYAEVHAICKEAGRLPRKGMHNQAILNIVKNDLGLIAVKHDLRKDDGGQFTMRTIREQLRPDSIYLIFQAKHVAAIVNNEVVDWSKDRCKRVEEVYEIVETATDAKFVSKLVVRNMPSRPVKNGASKNVWAIAERIAEEEGRGEDFRELVLDACEDAGINLGTAKTQFARFNRHANARFEG